METSLVQSCLPRSSLLRGHRLERLPSLPKVMSTLPTIEGSTYYLQMLDKVIESNNLTLEMLEEQEKTTSATFEEMKNQLKQIMASAKVSNSIIPMLQCSPPPDVTERQLALQVVDFPSIPLYVKRKFHITFRVINKNGDVVDFDQPLYCALSVLKVTADCEEVTETRTGIFYSGKPILRGQVAKGFRPQESMSFQGLVFLDISGPFPQGRFNLLVRCINFQDIKPLLIEGIRVKARKKRPEESF